MKFSPLFLLVLSFAFVNFVAAQTNVAAEKLAVTETTRIFVEVVKNFFSELQNANITAKNFHSFSDNFCSRFSFSRFLTFRKLHFIILVNPQVFEKNAPADDIHAIIAHEIAHAAY